MLEKPGDTRAGVVTVDDDVASGKNGGGWPMTRGEVPVRDHITGVAAIAMVVALLGLAQPGAPIAAQEPEAPALAATPTQPAGAAGRPEILRGSVVPQPAIEPAAGPEEPRIVAGDRVWFVDREAGRLTACRLITTIQVGGQAVRCTERRLPRGAALRD
jgi:hypothetical protein